MFLFLILDVDTQVNKQVFFLFRSVMKNAPQHTCPHVAGFGITDEKLRTNRLQFYKRCSCNSSIINNNNNDFYNNNNNNNNNR